MILTPEQRAWVRADAMKQARKLTDSTDVEHVGRLGRALIGVKASPQDTHIEIAGIATCDMLDCDEEVILPEGLDWSVFMQYKVLYSDHMYGTRNAVATVRCPPTRTTMPNGWKVQALLMPDHYNDAIPQVRMLAERGALGFSIGFIPIEWGDPSPDEAKRYKGVQTVIRKAKVFEVSCTPMPCNLACRAVLAHTDDSKAATVREMVTKGLLPSWYGGGPRPVVLEPEPLVLEPSAA